MPIFGAAPVMGGSLDATGVATRGYSVRGGRILTTDNYECTWDLLKTIPSLTETDKSVFDETVTFNKKAPCPLHGAACGQTPRQGARPFNGLFLAGSHGVAQAQHRG